MTDDRERHESWVETENTQDYTPDTDPASDEAWVQTANTEQYDTDTDTDTDGE